MIAPNTRFRCVAALLLATAMLPSSALSQTANSTTEGAATEKQQLLQKFAGFYVPTDVSTEGALANYERQFLRSFESESASAAMEKQYPGLTRAALAAGKAVVEKALRQYIPQSQLEVVQYMDSKFTTDELVKINAFYGKLVIQSSMKDIVGNIDTDKIADDMKAKMRTGNGEIAVDKDQVLSAATASAMQTMTDDQIKAYSEFVRTPTGRKFMLNADSLVDIVAKSTSKSMNEVMGPVQQAVMTAARDHMAKR